MRHKVFLVALVLMMVLMLVALAGCQREASVRSPAGATGAVSATGASTSASAKPTAAGGLISPAGGVTVISAVPTASGSAPSTAVPSAGGSITPTVEIPTPVVVQPAATQTPASSSAEYTLYTVQQGDTLYAIGVRYGVTVDEIAAANGLADPSTIVVGQVLKIPTGGTTSPEPGTGQCRYYHTVKPGEWIWQIARDYGADPYAILQANGLTVETGSNITAGDRLCIP